jgi:hypothetical protein
VLHGSHAGDEAELSFTVKYAPPETVQAYNAGVKTILADDAADVWALGVRQTAMHAQRHL